MNHAKTSLPALNTQHKLGLVKQRSRERTIGKMCKRQMNGRKVIEPTGVEVGQPRRAEWRTKEEENKLQVARNSDCSAAPVEIMPTLGTYDSRVTTSAAAA